MLNKEYIENITSEGECYDYLKEFAEYEDEALLTKILLNSKSLNILKALVHFVSDESVCFNNDKLFHAILNNEFFRGNFQNSYEDSFEVIKYIAKAVWDEVNINTLLFEICPEELDFDEEHKVYSILLESEYVNLGVVEKIALAIGIGEYPDEHQSEESVDRVYGENLEFEWYNSLRDVLLKLADNGTSALRQNIARSFVADTEVLEYLVECYCDDILALKVLKNKRVTLEITLEILEMDDISVPIDAIQPKFYFDILDRKLLDPEIRDELIKKMASDFEKDEDDLRKLIDYYDFYNWEVFEIIGNHPNCSMELYKLMNSKKDLD